MTKARRVGGFALKTTSGCAVGVRFKRRWLTCEFVWKPLPFRMVVSRSVSYRLSALLAGRAVKRVSIVLADNLTPAMKRAAASMVEFHKALAKAGLVDAS